MLQLEVAGGHAAVLKLPQASGTTAAGRTTLTFEHRDPGDSRWSLGVVRISFFPQADSIGIEVGGLVVQGPCDYALALVQVDRLEGALTCDDDLQATFQGDPRKVTLRGSFSAVR
jgi:hypothetical protein